MKLDPTLIHQQLGTDEFCRRLKELEPKRAPLYAERELIYRRLQQVQTGWWEWIETCEDWLPPPLRELRIQERELLELLQQNDQELDAMTRATMEAGIESPAGPAAE